MNRTKKPNKPLFSTIHMFVFVRISLPVLFTDWYIFEIGNKKDRMSIYSNEPSCPLSKQELLVASNFYSEALRTRTFKI